MANGCDHTAFSPKGTVVMSNFPTHDGHIYWYANCCRCNHILTQGYVDSSDVIREIVKMGKIPSGEDTV